MKHRVLRCIAGGHIIPRICPYSLTAASRIFEIIALRNHVTVVSLIIGHRRDAESFSAGHEMFRQQIILEIRFMRRITRLTLKRLHSAVEFRKADRIPLGNQMCHILRFRLGLEGIVTVQIETAGRRSGQISTPLHIFLRNDNIEYIVQKLIDAYRLLFYRIILFQIHLSGYRFTVSGVNIAEIGGGIFYEIRNSYRARSAFRTHLFRQLRLSFRSEACKPVVTDLSALACRCFHQHPCKFQDTV